MSSSVFIAADTPLPQVTPSHDYPLHINLDTGTIFDGGADDNYTMPGTDGFEICPRIRDHMSCPILFLTARIEDTDKVKGLVCFMILAEMYCRTQWRHYYMLI